MLFRSPRAKTPGTVTGERPPVVLYTSASCGSYCDEARQFLSRFGVTFQEIRVEDEPALLELKKLSPDGALPTLVVGSARVAGFNAQQMSDALDAAGYKGPPAGDR